MLPARAARAGGVRYPPRVPSRRPVVALAAVLAIALGVAALVVFGLPFDPFEGAGPPLTAMLPEGLSAVARCDGSALAASEPLRRLAGHPALAPVREAAGLDDERLAPLRALAVRLSGATYGLGPSLSRDLLGGEVVVGLRDDDVLVLARITGRAKALEFARALAPERLAALGLRSEGDGFWLERDDMRPVYARRFRDVFVAATSRGLVDGCVALAERALEAPRPAGPYDAELDAGVAPRDRLLFRAAPERVARALDALPELPAAAAPVLAALRAEAQPGAEHAGAAPVVGSLAVGDRQALVLTLSAALPAPRADADADGDGDGVRAAELGDGAATALRERAARFAAPGEACVVAGLAVRTEDVVRTLLEAQPDARRELVDELLAEHGRTTATFARALAEHLQDGVGVVVARLREADALELDDPDGGGVHPIPATLVLLRLRPGTTGAAFVSALAEEAEAAFGAHLRLAPEELPGGALLHTLDGHGFGGEWALLRPAVALVGDTVVVATHEGYLRRALAEPAAAEPPVTGPGGALDVDVVFEPLRRLLDDGRWEAAEHATYHDWRAERQAIRAELDRANSVLRPEDRVVYEDERIAQRIERRKREEFPAAIAAYRRGNEALEAFRRLRATLDVDGAAWSLRLRIE